MTNNSIVMPTSTHGSVIYGCRSLLNSANRIPLSIIQLAARLALANVLWNSAQSKFANWSVTRQRFAMEYRVPLLPPDIAAPLATAIELCGSLLILFGLFARVGALALLGVVIVIQLFTFPGNWGEYLLWTSLLLLVPARGPGKASFDYLAERHFKRSI
jgi:putative oxidoreductase